MEPRRAGAATTSRGAGGHRSERPVQQLRIVRRVRASGGADSRYPLKFCHLVNAGKIGIPSAKREGQQPERNEVRANLSRNRTRERSLGKTASFPQSSAFDCGGRKTSPAKGGAIGGKPQVSHRDSHHLSRLRRWRSRFKRDGIPGPLKAGLAGGRTVRFRYQLQPIAYDIPDEKDEKLDFKKSCGCCLRIHNTCEANFI